MFELENKLWKKQDFCTCGADSYHYCKCAKEDILEFKRKLNRRTKDEFGDRVLNLMKESAKF